MKLFSSAIDRFRRGVRRFHDEEESGVAMTEFAIAFPLQFFVTLALMQFSLLMIGHVLTQHAAFAAARAALVADIPDQTMTNQNPNQMRAQQQRAAKRAACYVVMAVCPLDSDPDFRPTPAPTGQDGAIAFQGPGKSSDAAWALVSGPSGNDNQMVTTDANDEYVGAFIEFDFPLIIPVVNHWFAKIQAGTSGEFWYGPKKGTAYNQASNKQKMSCYRIAKSAFVAKPWRSQ